MATRHELFNAGDGTVARWEVDDEGETVREWIAVRDPETGAVTDPPEIAAALLARQADPDQPNPTDDEFKTALAAVLSLG